MIQPAMAVPMTSIIDADRRRWRSSSQRSCAAVGQRLDEWWRTRKQMGWVLTSALTKAPTRTASAMPLKGDVDAASKNADSPAGTAAVIPAAPTRACSRDCPTACLQAVYHTLLQFHACYQSMPPRLGRHKGWQICDAVQTLFHQALQDDGGVFDCRRTRGMVPQATTARLPFQACTGKNASILPATEP